MAKAIVAADNSNGNQSLAAVKAPVERLTSFLHDVRSEMRKVIAPSREDTQNNTIIVLVTVFIFATYFWAVDTLIGRGVEALLHKLTHH